MHFNRRRFFRKGLEFHVCTITKSAHTKKVRKLIVCTSYIYIYIYIMMKSSVDLWEPNCSVKDVNIWTSYTCDLFYSCKSRWGTYHFHCTDDRRMIHQCFKDSLKEFSLFFNSKCLFEITTFYLAADVPVMFSFSFFFIFIQGSVGTIESTRWHFLFFLLISNLKWMLFLPTQA